MVWSGIRCQQQLPQEHESNPLCDPAGGAYILDALPTLSYVRNHTWLSSIQKVQVLVRSLLGNAALTRALADAAVGHGMWETAQHY